MSHSAIFCSVIIPSIGRPSLERAVTSVLTQELDGTSFEVVVVNDSGKPLPPAAWQQAAQVRVVSTQRRKLVIARNTGAAVANGRYLLFLDDDDWLLPGALDHFRRTAQQHGEAACVFGSFALVDEEGAEIARHGLQKRGNVSVELVSGRWMQVASTAVRADAFFAAGGFSPLFPISEELDLFDRLSIAGDFAGDDTLVAGIFRGRSWQTSVDYSGMYEYNRLLRDRSLSLPHAFGRLWQSAEGNSYWQGRIVRLYMVAMIWNWRRRRSLTTGASRGVYALRALLGAPANLFAKEFWSALRHDLPAA
jgi:glycosyltransferase involved in cell wall biosynthesis